MNATDTGSDATGGRCDPPGSGSVVRRWPRWAAACAAIVVLLLALGYLTVNEVRANARFDRAHAADTTTQAHLSLVLSQLAEVRHSLSVVNGQVAQNHQVLIRDTEQLSGLETELATSQVNLSHENQTVVALQACLSGVEQASNALAVNDQAKAIAALQSVTASCTAAVDADG